MRISHALLVVFVLMLVPAAPAQEPSRKCTCQQGNGSYLWLRSPKGAPDDPDPCPSVHDGLHPKVPLPKSWNNLCYAQPRMGCFLRRHAASWQIVCTMCATQKCCPFPNWHNCPECHAAGKDSHPAQQ